MHMTYLVKKFITNFRRRCRWSFREMLICTGSGLHGPDILFYHMLKPKVSITGIRMHKEKAAPFFERGMAIVRETAR